MRTAVLLVCAALTLAGVGCSAAKLRASSEGRAIDPAEAGANFTLVTLRDEALEVGLDSVPAGTQEFVAANVGTQDHEFVIVPVDDDGRYGEPIADTDTFGPQERRAIRFEYLGPGTYELVCLLMFADFETDTFTSHMS